MNSSYHDNHCVAPSRHGVELQHRLSGGIALHPLVRQRRAGSVAAELFQAIPVFGFAQHGRVQSEAVSMSAHRSYRATYRAQHAALDQPKRLTADGAREARLLTTGSHRRRKQQR